MTRTGSIANKVLNIVIEITIIKLKKKKNLAAC